MSLAQQKQIDLLKSQVATMRSEMAWVKREIKTGLQDVIERVVRENIEIDIEEKTTDEKIKDLINGD